MRASTRILVASAILLGLNGCAINRAQSQRMLDERASYGGDPAQNQPPELKEAGLDGYRNSPVPVRSRGRVAAIYIHRHETASRDYFWGGWLSVVIEEPSWTLTKPNQLTPAVGIGPGLGMPPSPPVQAPEKKSEPAKRELKSINVERGAHGRL